MEAVKLIETSFGTHLKRIFDKTDKKILIGANEIRIRVNRPVIVVNKTQEFLLNAEGQAVQRPELAYVASADDVRSIIEIISGYSLYAFEEQLKNGYITVEGGHRIGITGQAVVENGKIKTFKNINGLNIRITRQIKGCAEPIFKTVMKPNIKNTLIISPPGYGKTTLLRDLVRLCGNTGGINVSVCDERSEIAGCYLGVPQNDIGFRTDIIDACPKAEAMMILLRSMSPKIIAVDEIGTEEDFRAIESILNSGSKVFCTVHGTGINDLKNRMVFDTILLRKIFEIYIVLGENESSSGAGIGKIKSIYDSNFNRII